MRATKKSNDSTSVESLADYHMRATVTMVIVWVLFHCDTLSLGIPIIPVPRDAFRRRDIRVLEELVAS
jgi:hypothetical protein